MNKRQFINLIESINNVVESRRGYGYEYGGERYANFPTEAEVPSGGYDDPAFIQSQGKMPAAPHSNVSQSMGSHPSMVPTIQAKEFGASGKQLSLASYMPHRSKAYHPYPYLNDPVIRDNLHGIPEEAHAKLLDMAKNVYVNSPETIRELGHFLISQGVDPKHPHIQGLFRDADFHDQMNDERYSRY